MAKGKAVSKRRTTFGQQIITELTELADVIESGEPISDHYTVHEVAIFHKTTEPKNPHGLKISYGPKKRVQKKKGK